MDSRFFSGNRERLLSLLGDELVMLSAYTSMQSSADEAAEFSQEANFWWLSGIEEADWQLIMDGNKGECWLVEPDISEVQRIFEGGLTREQALSISGCDKVISEIEAKSLLEGLSSSRQKVYTLGESRHEKLAGFVLNPAQRRLRNKLRRMFGSVNDCRPELNKLRSIKQTDEISAIEKAVSLTSEAFREVRSNIGNFRYEYEIEAEIVYRFRNNNATHAFRPIVASGKNACTLHYGENSSGINKEDLILIDIGARYNNYPADITRTFSTGEISKRKVEVHQAVRQAESQIIELLRPGLSIKEYMKQVDIIMKGALVSLGLMRSVEDDLNYRRYFPHAISHGLGVDVHESLGGNVEFQPGMVLTVEPGIYIPEEGIGVRIEDDVLVTDSSRRNLSINISTDF